MNKRWELRFNSAIDSFNRTASTVPSKINSDTSERFEGDCEKQLTTWRGKQDGILGGLESSFDLDVASCCRLLGRCCSSPRRHQIRLWSLRHSVRRTASTVPSKINSDTSERFEGDCEKQLTTWRGKQDGILGGLESSFDLDVASCCRLLGRCCSSPRRHQIRLWSLRHSVRQLVSSS